jgi:hypothetical protein
MKSGIFIIAGIVLWVISLIAVETYWIHQSRLSTVAAGLISIFGIVWLTHANNRRILGLNFFPKKYGFQMEKFAEHIRDGFITVGIIAIFGLITIIAELGKTIISTTEGYREATEHLRVNNELTDKIGTIKDIRLGNSFGFSNKNGREEYRLSFIAFGEMGTTTIELTSVKESSKWQVKTTSNKR